MQRVSLLFLAFFLTLTAGVATAQEDVGESRLPGLTAAKPIHREPPTYPAFAVRKEMEGWVLVNYSVRADGSVGDAAIVDSSDRFGRFDREALEAIRQWRFEPATLNGQPVEQKNTLTNLTFALRGLSEDPKERGASEWLTRRARQFDQAMAGNDLAKASSILAEIEERGTVNLYELGHIFARWGQYHDVTGNLPMALLSYQRANRIGSRYVEPGMALTLLVRQFALELKLGHAQDALRTFKKIKELRNAPPADDPVMLSGANLERFRDSGATLAVSGDVVVPCRQYFICAEGEAFWWHGLLRRSVTVEKVTGDVRRLDFRCEVASASHPVETGKTFTIPESWGDCDLVVVGEPGAKIDMVEG